MRITWYGHAAFLIAGEDRILVDPFLTGNPNAPITHEEAICDIICVTHGHGDHFGDAIDIAKRTGAPIVAMHEIVQFASTKGASGEGINTGGSVTVGKTKITMVPAWHSSGVALADYSFDGGLPAGFIIEAEGKRIYHAGDTSLMQDMKWIGEVYKPDIALLPIGDRFTMNPETAAIAVEWIKPKIAIPMHYNTFPLIEQEPEEFKMLAEGKGVGAEVVILNPGGSWEG